MGVAGQSQQLLRSLGSTVAGMLSTPLVITWNMDRLTSSDLVHDHTATPADLTGNLTSQLGSTLVVEVGVEEVLTAPHLVEEAVQAWVKLHNR